MTCPYLHSLWSNNKENQWVTTACAAASTNDCANESVRRYQRHICTSRDTVPGSSVGDALFEAWVIIILAAWWPVWVRHHRVITGVSLSQTLKHQIIWTGTVLVSRAWWWTERPTFIHKLYGFTHYTIIQPITLNYGYTDYSKLYDCTYNTKLY